MKNPKRIKSTRIFYIALLAIFTTIILLNISIQTKFFIICTLATWLFIVPARQCINRKYRRCFWWIFIPLFTATTIISAATQLHDKWYAEGLSVIICAIAASQISIRIYPNVMYKIEYISGELHACPYMQIPYWSMLAAQYYYHNNKGYNDALKYACLAIHTIDSVEPSDLIANPYTWIKADPIFCRLVYTSIVDNYYTEGLHKDIEYCALLDKYRNLFGEPATSIQIDQERARFWSGNK